MGGTTELFWRGVRICSCMKAPLDELAKLTGSGFKVTPIPGFGSYQDGSTASGSTATGGAHIDIYLTGYSSATKLRVEALARKIGFYADIREPKWYSKWYAKWITKTWASHLHMILKGCPHMSDGAKAQLAEWFRGENGLAGGDLDDGPREYLYQTWEGYLAGRIPAIPDVEGGTYTVKKGDTLGKIAAALGITLAALLVVNPQIKDPNVIQPGQSVTVPTQAKPSPGVVVTPAPAPKPAPVPAPAPKPAPAPAPKPAPVAKPSTSSLAGVSTSQLRAGKRSAAVKAYQSALRNYLGSATARRLNPTGASGYYGAQTEAMTRAAYRKLGWLSGDTRYPGPSLLKVLRGHAPAKAAKPAKPATVTRVDASKLTAGTRSRHVTAYQRALRAYLGKSANAYNPAGATGYYGSQTEAMTRAVYRKLAKKQGSSWLRGDTRYPGSSLLKVLGLR